MQQLQAKYESSSGQGDSLWKEVQGSIQTPSEICVWTRTKDVYKFSTIRTVRLYQEVYWPKRTLFKHIFSKPYFIFRKDHAPHHTDSN